MEVIEFLVTIEKYLMGYLSGRLPSCFAVGKCQCDPLWESL